jgi:hypothetical protein
MIKRNLLARNEKTALQGGLFEGVVSWGTDFTW